MAKYCKILFHHSFRTADLLLRGCNLGCPLLAQETAEVGGEAVHRCLKHGLWFMCMGCAWPSASPQIPIHHLHFLSLSLSPCPRHWSSGLPLVKPQSLRRSTPSPLQHSRSRHCCASSTGGPSSVPALSDMKLSIPNIRDLSEAVPAIKSGEHIHQTFGVSTRVWGPTIEPRLLICMSCPAQSVLACCILARPPSAISVLRNNCWHAAFWHDLPSVSSPQLHP